MTQRIRLGDLLVSSKVVTEAQVNEALARQKETGRRLGETLVALGYVTELQVAQTLSHQLSVPWANLLHVDFSRELLNLVTPDVAVSSRVVPIYVRRVRQQGDVLFVATDDPLNEAALLAVATHVGMPVKAMVASALDLRNALRVYYGRDVAAPEAAHPSAAAMPGTAGGEELEIEVDIPVSILESLRPAARRATAAERREPPAAAEQVPALTETADEPAPILITKVKPGREALAGEGDAARPTPEPAEPTPAAGPVTAEPTAPEPKKTKTKAATSDDSKGAGATSLRQKRTPAGPRMLTLTLLDGTSVKLPAPSRAAEEEPSAEHHLTSRDLIQALLLHAEGKDVSDVLRDAHWETLFATLLSLMLKKGLVADWEFVEEWTKMRRARSGG